MIYVTPFFQGFYPNYIKINSDELDSISDADAVAVDTYYNNFESFKEIISNLVRNSKKIYLYLGEPTDDKQFINFLTTFDLPNIHFYSDCVLNFNLSYATFTPAVNWFIDPVNYYTRYQWAKDLLGKLTYGFDKSYRFDILLGQSKLHRDKLDQLVSSSHFKHLCIYSYFKDSISNGVYWDCNIDPTRHVLTSELFKINGEDARPSALLPVDVYNQSYYSIVCESTVYNSYNQYTEKVAKPMLARRPFVAFSGQYYMKNLKSLGFKTFDSVLDESYDLEANEDVRYNLAWQQVEWLCQQDPTRIFDQLNPILAHNQQHFLNTDWAAPIKNLF